jgi:hypothetical protein
VRRPILSILLFALDCGPTMPARESPSPAAKLAPAAPALPSAPSRVVAIGDLLGDRERSERALSLAGVVSSDGRWSGGSTIVVQLGDLTLPGPDTKAVLERWMALGDEAAAAGGKVVVVLGEHETLDLLGEWKQIAPADIRSFGDGGGRKAALSANEPLGRWLRARDAAVDVAGSVFVHGGIGEKWAEVELSVLSSQVRAAIAKTGPAFVLGAEGPLRYRGILRNDAVAGCGELAKTLVRLGAERMVVGHGSPPSGRPEMRCGGQAIWVGGANEPGVVEIGPAGVRSIGGEGPTELRAQP